MFLADCILCIFGASQRFVYSLCYQREVSGISLNIDEIEKARCFASWISLQSAKTTRECMALPCPRQVSEGKAVQTHVVKLKFDPRARRSARPYRPRPAFSARRFCLHSHTREGQHPPLVGGGLRQLRPGHVRLILGAEGFAPQRRHRAQETPELLKGEAVL